MVDILVEHVEELEFLWGQRLNALDDPAYLHTQFLDLEERLLAHVDGLLVGPDRLLELLGPGLAAKSATEAFASAYPLLANGSSDNVRAVVDAFQSAQGSSLEGLGQAMAHSSRADVVPVLREAARSEAPEKALAALEALAYRSPNECGPEPLAPFMSHVDPAVRARCWRVAALLKSPLVATRYRKAVDDPDPTARSWALWAAAWGKQAWLVDHCRALVKAPSPGGLEPLRVLAVLGTADDLPRFRDGRWAAALGPAWYQILGVSGQLGVLPELVKGMEESDPRRAVAAGAAFARITGGDVASTQRVTLPPPDGRKPDAFDSEFLDQAFLPDPARAREHIKRAKDALGRGGRWHRGLELTRENARQQLDLLDVPMRRETCLRARFDGRWPVGLADLTRFPLTG
jgi:uncharacterized protein (TIGR02270 family)